MDLPSRQDAVNVELVKKRLDYVETKVPRVHFNERLPREDTIFGVDRIVYAFAADDNLRSYMATLQYFLVRGGLTAWKRPSEPLPSTSWAIARKQVALMQTNLPISEAEPARFANGEGVLCYTPLGDELEGKHGAFIFSSDPMTIPPRVEIRLKISEDPLSPDIWKPLIERVVTETQIVDLVT